MTAKKKAVKSKSAKPKGKPGGKPGNQNARKHGLWAKNQPKAKTGESKPETNAIENRRRIMDEVIETLYDKFSRLDDIDQVTKCANSISLAVTAANGCDRTLAITSGKLTNLQSAIESLFANEDPYDARSIE